MADPEHRPGLTAVEFQPLDGNERQRRAVLSPAQWVLAIVSLAAVAILTFLFAARAVIFELEPADAQLEIGGLSFNIGNNYLLLRGGHRITASAHGYYELEQEILVGPGRTQEVQLALEPLPGRLEVSSPLDQVEVLVDGEAAGTVPGTLEEIGKGSHIFEFSRHRYFPLKREIEIEGLGRTQRTEVILEPAWGQMSFTSVPAGAELQIDGVAVGVTPMTTEVLETGTQVTISLRGYKTWDRQVTIKAGTSEDYPPVELIVADGTLDITSTPRGAGVTVDGEFRGSTPVEVPLSPLSDHRVELYLEGYRKAVRTVDIEPEQEKSLSINLSPIIGRIALDVGPPDAAIFVDGSMAGSGSQVLSLTAREHTISVRKAGYESQDYTLTPRPEQEQALEVRLMTLQQAYWSRRPPSIQSPVGTPMKLFRPNAGFTLGAPRREPGRRANEAERKVQLERPFYIGTHEITNGEFRAWKDEHTSRAMRGHTLDMDNQPVAYVSWQEAALFCNWLSRREGLPVFYIEQGGMVTGFNVDSHGYRMPTEAEWAYVAKINAQGEAEVFPWGSEQYPPAEVIANYADLSAIKFMSFTLSNYNDGFPVSAPVGSFDPNRYGMHDLGGNVAEWINDYYEIRASGETELDPSGPATGSRHVIRGASWAMGSRSELRLTYRDAGSDPRMDLGFRLARYVDRMGATQ